MRVFSILLLNSLFAAAQTPAEPRLSSVHPFTSARGATISVVVRGNALRAARAVVLDDAPLSIAIERTEAEPPNEATARSKTPFDLVYLKVRATADAAPGRYLFRLVTPQGLSNALPLYVTDQPLMNEPKEPVTQVPAVIAGRIERRGEADLFAIDVKAGQMLTFQAISGLPSIGGPGGNANGFDPSLTLLEPTGSWFDPSRLKRIAFNDEPLWVAGRLTDAHLVHRFEKAGRYYLRVEAFSGQGGPDYSYHVRILDGAAPPPPNMPATGEWEERSFSRRLTSSRLNELASRGGKPATQKSIETYRPGDLKLPATIEGDLTQPGETHRARFHLDGPQDIAIEVETPAAAPPLFNPIVRLLNAAGEEVATNIFAGRGACTGALSKAIQAKTVVPLRNPGDYTVEIRETTADLAAPDFRYRVQIRPQVPHIGQIRIDEDRLNVAPGAAKTVRVNFDREEDYRGAIAVSAEGLPPGVSALTGADFEPDKDPPLYPGKRERYVPRSERTVVIFSAAADAKPMEQPLAVRLLMRPMVDGKLGDVIATKTIPLMITAKP